MSSINTLSVFFLNLWRHKTYEKNSKQIHEYIDNLCKFAEFYLKSRYGLDIQVNSYWPYAVPKTYADVQKYDAQKWLDAGFGRQLQMYCGYGLQLRPHEDAGTFKGYCECTSGGEMPLQTADMNYADMPAYAPGGFFGSNIYAYYGEFSRAFFHELDHQIGRLLMADWWLNGVHKAAKMPLITWSALDYKNVPLSATSQWQDKQRNEIYFVTQRDPREV